MGEAPSVRIRVQSSGPPALLRALVAPVSPRVRPSRVRPGAGCAGRGRTAHRTWQPMRGLIRFPRVNAATERRERRATDTSTRVIIVAGLAQITFLTRPGLRSI